MSVIVPIPEVLVASGKVPLWPSSASNAAQIDPANLACLLRSRK